MTYKSFLEHCVNSTTKYNFDDKHHSHTRNESTCSFCVVVICPQIKLLPYFTSDSSLIRCWTQFYERILDAKQEQEKCAASNKPVFGSCHNFALNRRMRLDSKLTKTKKRISKTCAQHTRRDAKLFWMWICSTFRHTDCHSDLILFAS